MKHGESNRRLAKEAYRGTFLKDVTKAGKSANDFDRPLAIHGTNHAVPRDIVALLVSPQGRQSVSIARLIRSGAKETDEVAAYWAQ